MPVIPTVIESDGRAERAFDIYSRLLRDRIVFLGREVDDEIANLIVAQLLLLEADDPDRDIALYVNSPGGSAYAGMAIYDAMQHVRPDVSTICFGMGMSAAAMIMTGGAAGKRFALPNAKLMIHQGSAGFRGAPSDIQIAAREVAATTRQMAEIIGRHAGRDIDTVMEDIDRDRFMTPAEAVDYGLVDAILPPPVSRRRAVASRRGVQGPPSCRRRRTDLDEAVDDVRAPASAAASSTASSSPSRASRLRPSSSARSRIELLAPTDADTPVGRFLARRGPGVHHLAYEVDDVGPRSRGPRRRRRRARSTPLPRIGLFGLQVAFIHPDAVHGVLTEVVAVARPI